MKVSLFIVGLSATLLISGCQKPEGQEASKVEAVHEVVAHDIKADEGTEAEAPIIEQVKRDYVLPATIVPISDSKPNFGIDLTKLTPKEVSVIESAWQNFELILAGKEPKCSATFGLSDGGSMMYDCGTYEIMRIKGLAEKDGKYGYDYGPSLDFLNGHKVEHLKFYTDEQIAKLERAP